MNARLLGKSENPYDTRLVFHKINVQKFRTLNLSGSEIKIFNSFRYFSACYPYCLLFRSRVETSGTKFFSFHSRCRRLGRKKLKLPSQFAFFFLEFIHWLRFYLFSKIIPTGLVNMKQRILVGKLISISKIQTTISVVFVADIAARLV